VGQRDRTIEEGMEDDYGAAVAVVDDDESLRRSLRNLLGSKGFRVAARPRKSSSRRPTGRPSAAWSSICD
jgi:PleD family two-component response regulator